MAGLGAAVGGFRRVHRSVRVLVALFGVGFLGERLAPVNWLGILMIAAGAWLVTLRS
jgi:uncharacterized membrane protein